jgi:hypothetical protein
MTIPQLTCDEFADTLADFLEREVDERTRAAVEAHALSCGDCGPLLADLRKLRIDAANLALLEPSRDLWAGIAERIETPVVELRGGRPMAGGRRQYVWLGLAAAALVGITAGVTHRWTKASVGVQTALVRAPTAAPRVDTVFREAQATSREPQAERRTPHAASRLVSNKLSAEQTYDLEITRLRAIVNRRHSQLDSTTIAVIEHNLQIIDDAITQCKAALRKDPASRFLIESLNDALDTKVQLLRTAAMLPARS